MSAQQQAAFVRRLDEHRGILFKVASVYCRSPSDREDLAQEIIAQLWRSYGRFDRSKSFATWMYRIAVNVAISFYRRAGRRARSFVPVDESLVESLASPVADEGDERLAVLHQYIEQLDEFDRALMILYLDDYPYAAIAEILGISETNVATKINRIKHKLKRAVAGAPPI